LATLLWEESQPVLTMPPIRHPVEIGYYDHLVNTERVPIAMNNTNSSRPPVTRVAQTAQEPIAVSGW
jgi:hypothetical protein